LSSSPSPHISKNHDVIVIGGKRRKIRSNDEEVDGEGAQ
jgi:hypothetical protein